jgi:CRP/FNR family transcriptional regulator, anaerobic regulatory protein
MILRKFIENYSDIADSEWDSMEQLFVKKVYNKNEIILEEGSICRYFYFLESGLIRFYCNVDGTDLTKTFTIAPYCFTSRISFRKQTASNEGIQALEKTTVWQISCEQYKKLEQFNSWNIFMRKLLNEIQEFSDSFYLEIRTMTAENRYKKLISDYPTELIQKIPLKHLSSFLGIAPQSLSRIRKKNQGKTPKLT